MGSKRTTALARLHSAGIAQSGAALLRCRGRRLVNGPIRGAFPRMTKQQAEKINKGDIVLYGGKECRVNSVKTSGIAAPLFRLTYTSTGEGAEGGNLVSYKICSIPAKASA
jgi:hypothetical protein